MRQFFDDWGVELDDRTFARAVAARLADISRTDTTGEFVANWRTVRRNWTTSPQTAGDLAATWPAVLEANPSFRLIVPDVEPLRGDDADFAFSVIGWAGRAEPAVTSIIADTSVRGPIRVNEWKWPLQVGILPSSGARQIAQDTQFRDFFRVEEVRVSHAPWDILVAPGTISEAISALASRDAGLMARCVLVTGGRDHMPPGALGSALATVRTLTRAHAVVLVRVVPRSSRSRPADAAPETAGFLSDLAVEIAHDNFLDVALFVVARRRLAPTPLLSGDLAFFNSTRPSLRLRRLADKMVATGAKVKAPRIKDIPGFEGVRTREAAPDAEDAGRALRDNESSVDWSREIHAATGTAELVQAMAPEFEQAAATSDPRFVKVGVREMQGVVDADTWSAYLLSERRYALYVWISPDLPEPGVLRLQEPLPVPDEHDTHELEIVLNEPNLLTAPVVQNLRLPPVGDSTRCRFVLYSRPGVERIEARVIVLHRGRVLQTGVLRGTILTADTAPPPEQQLRFELDAVPRSRLAALGTRSTFGAAIIANHTAAGVPDTVGIAGQHAAHIRLGDESLRAITARFDIAISDIAEQPESYRTLRAPGTVGLLRDLAQHGASLHRALSESSEVVPGLVKEPRVQIVTTRVDAFLPLELAYRYEAPEDDASLCEGAEDALRADPETSADPGACSTKCGPSHGGTGKRICPMGFWCLFKTIERFSHRVEDTDTLADYILVAEPIGQRAVIPQPSMALVAASTRATTHDARVVRRVMQLVRKTVGKGLQAHDWKGWTDDIQAAHPGLLVLIPHHLREAGTSLLEIGTNSKLKSTLVKKKHAIGDPPPDPVPTPILLLLGCETQDATIAFENFPAAFRRGGAVVVIATIATVLGRDAGPTAEALIRLLAKQPGPPRSFGDVLLSARRKLLVEGKAMALALAGFGDADWRLA